MGQENLYSSAGDISELFLIQQRWTNVEMLDLNQKHRSTTILWKITLEKSCFSNFWNFENLNETIAKNLRML